MMLQLPILIKKKNKQWNYNIVFCAIDHSSQGLEKTAVQDMVVKRFVS